MFNHALKFRNVFILLCTCMVVSACSREKFNPAWLKERAPEKYTAEFETSEGNFLVAVQRHHAPVAADRFYQLVKNGYFDNGLFYRVIKNYVAQFGNTNLDEMEKWRQFPLRDEPVRLKNHRGTLSFAQSGPQTRDLEVFINLTDNPELDTVAVNGTHGFPAFGKVIRGMQVVDRLNTRYADKPMMSPLLYDNRTRFYSSFPDIDIIYHARIID